MRLPQLFLQMHGEQLFRLFQNHGEVVRIVPREPLGPVSLDEEAIESDAMATVITIRCINDHGVVRFEAFSPADQKAAVEWAGKHQNTTREQFDWLPFVAADDEVKNGRI